MARRSLAGIGDGKPCDGAGENVRDQAAHVAIAVMDRIAARTGGARLLEAGGLIVFAARRLHGGA